MPWNTRLAGDATTADYPPSSPTAVAYCTASLREETPIFRYIEPDFGADGVARHEQPFPDLAEREMGLQVGEKPKLRGGEGRPAGQRHLSCLGEGRAEFRYFVDQRSQSRPVAHDVVDLPQQVACGRLVGDGGVDLGQLQAYAYGKIGDGERAGRPGPHGLGELTIHLFLVASVHSEPGRGGEGQHAHGVIVQP